MKILLTIIFCLNCLVCFSQADSIEKIIATSVERIIRELQNDQSHYHRELNELFIANPDFSYYTMKKHESDNSDFVVEGIVNYYRMLKEVSEDSSFRQKITYDLLQIYQENKQSLNSYDTYGIPRLMSSPEDNKPSDFNTEAKHLLADLLQDSLISIHISKVVGIAAMKGQIPELKKFLPDGERYQKPRNENFYFSSWEWYSRLAMARLGNKKQIDFCVQKIEDSENEIISNYYSAGSYFDDLVYINQPEVLSFLFEMLISNKTFSGRPLFSTSGLAIHALQRLLVGFPPEVGFSLTEKGVKEYERWIRDNKGKYKFKE